RCRMEDLKGGDTQENVEITRGVLKGEPGPRREIVLLNAAAAIVAGGKAKDLTQGIEEAARSIDSGKAMKKLEELISLTNA
ncbi:anthranilate phosphoribosyltransferase, partial [bacterium]|nr:anthranilate phosphoribosyltransferase [bacterium]